MSARNGNRKRNGRMACFLVLGLLALSVHAAGADDEPKAAIGFYLGGAGSMGTSFIDVTSGGHTRNRYTPNFLLGGYFQLDFTPAFSLQLSANYQGFTNRWEFHYWDMERSGYDSAGAFSISLNGIITVGRSPMSSFYLLAGAGFLAGSFENLGGLLQLAGGAGVQIRLAPGSPAYFDLAAVIHPVIGAGSESDNPTYLKLQAGIGIQLRERNEGAGD